MGTRHGEILQALRRGSGPVLALALTLVVAASGPARASAFDNGGFETGTMQGWQEAPAPGGSVDLGVVYPADGSQPSATPPEGTWFAILTPGLPDSYTQLSQTFDGQTGQVLSCQNFFDGTDPLDPDRAEVRILRGGTPIATVFEAVAGPDGLQGLQAWTTWSYQLTENGSYTLEARVINVTDEGLPSILGMDACLLGSPAMAANFNASTNGARIRLAWQTSGELNNAGFNLYRATSSAGPFLLVNQQVIPGTGSGQTGSSYSYTDVPGAGDYYYRLDAISVTGEVRVLGTTHVVQPMSPFRRPLRQPIPPPL